MTAITPIFRRLSWSRPVGDDIDVFARFAYDNSSAAIMILDQKGIIHCNAATVRMFGGSSLQGMLGRHPGELSPEKQPDGRSSAEAAQKIMDEAQSKGAVSFEWTHWRLDNKAPIQVMVSLQPTLMNGRPIILVTYQDIAMLCAAREAQRRATHDLADVLEQKIQAVVRSLTQTIDRLAASAATLSSNAEQTQRQSATVSTATEEATVSSASTELTASIREISRQVQQSATIVQAAATEAADANRKIAGLAEAAQKIGDVVNLINDIAGQTNLLALNATIESARAGEAGKGFAVVANEVKHLAGQTARATGEIAAQIATVQAETKAAVSAIAGISGTIEKINQLSAAIAGAVEEQGAATAEIARNVEQASSGTQEVAVNISSVAQAAIQTGSLAQKVNADAVDLRGHAGILEREVSDFLKHLRK